MSLINGNDSVNGSNVNSNQNNVWGSSSSQSNAAAAANVWDSESNASGSVSLNSVVNPIANNNNMNNNNNNVNNNNNANSTASTSNLAGGAVAASQAIDESNVVASCISNLSIQDWNTPETEPTASDQLSPSDSQISPEQPTGSASNAVATPDSIGEFERLTLQHLLKDDPNLDLFSDGWGRSAIDHTKPWKAALPQANPPAQPSFLPIASSAKPSLGAIEQQMHSQANAAPIGNWRSSGIISQSSSPGSISGATPTSSVDLWENSVHKGNHHQNNRGMPSVQTPDNDLSHWGQSPSVSSHIGGTWGEEEDNSNVWTGMPSANSASTWGMDDNKDKNWKSQSSWGDYDDKIDKNLTSQWDRQSSNGPGSMLNGRNNNHNNEGSFGTWNSNMVQNGNKKDHGWGEDNDHHNQIPNVDDGTNLWGASKRNANNATTPMSSNNQRWNDDAIGDGRIKTPNGQRPPIPNNSNNGQYGGPTSPGRMMVNKPNGLNKQNSIGNSSWNDMNSSNWNDYSKGNQMQSGGAHNNNHINKGGAGVWNNDNSSSMHWNGHKNPNGSLADSSEWANNKRRMLNREMILSSNQYRILVEMGFKPEDVENALRTCNMNLEETIEELRAAVLRETGFDSDRPKGFNHSSLSNNSNMVGRNNQMSNQMGAQASGIHGNQSGMRQQNNGPKHGNNSNNSAMPNMNSMPTEKQLNHLVQQIQLAVRSGHLNAQILNQPLGLPTIQLIYQLLQQIKTLQQLQFQIQQNSNKPMQSSLLSTLHIQVSQVRARISSLQNQIKFQQNVFMNQQSGNNSSGSKIGSGQSISMQSQASQQMIGSQLGATASNNNPNQLPPLGLNASSMDFKNLMQPDANNLVDFRPQPQQQLEQSRLNQWKMNSFNKDPSLSHSSSSFSRAPGSLKSSNNSSNLAQSSSGSPLDIGPTASAWSSLGLDEPNSPAGPNPLTNFLDNSDNFMNPNTFVSSVHDQVPEFQPGKPWKGSSQLKQFDNDSNWNSRSNELAFQSNQTWSFGSMRGNQEASTSQFKPSEWDALASANGTTSPGTSPIEQLWNRSSDAFLSKSRGPPPGMTAGKAAAKPDLSCDLQNLPESLDGVFGCGVIVMNLPPTADVFSLRRLFSQHGQVIAHFVKDDYVLFIYASMEEAEKAQRALNFCVIHGKTILVKPASPAEMALIMDCKKSSQPLLGTNQQQQQQQQQQQASAATNMFMNGCANNNNNSNDQSPTSSNAWMNNMAGAAAVGGSNKWSFDKPNSMNSHNPGSTISNSLWSMPSNDRDAATSASLQTQLLNDLLSETS